MPVIGFDMGGTSTDVSRFAGEFEHVFETTTAGRKTSSLHFTSHFTLPHFTSLHFTLHHFTSLHFASLHFTSLCITSLHISLHFTLHHFISSLHFSFLLSSHLISLHLSLLLSICCISRSHNPESSARHQHRGGRRRIATVFQEQDFCGGTGERGGTSR
jgi:hypothetical protein